MTKEKYAERLEALYEKAQDNCCYETAQHILAQIRELTKGDDNKIVNPPEGYTTTHVTDTILAASSKGPMLMLDHVNEEWVPMNWAAL